MHALVPHAPAGRTLRRGRAGSAARAGRRRRASSSSRRDPRGSLRFPVDFGPEDADEVLNPGLGSNSAPETFPKSSRSARVYAAATSLSAYSLGQARGATETRGRLALALAGVTTGRDRVLRADAPLHVLRDQFAAAGPLQVLAPRLLRYLLRSVVRDRPTLASRVLEVPAASTGSRLHPSRVWLAGHT